MRFKKYTRMEKSLDYRCYKSVWSPFSKLLFLRIISPTAQRLYFIRLGDPCAQDSGHSWVSVKLWVALDPAYLSSKPSSPPPVASSSLFLSSSLLYIISPWQLHTQASLLHKQICFLQPVAIIVRLKDSN